MITPDVSFQGFTARDWQRLATVFRAPAEDVARPRTRKLGGVVAVTTGNRLRKLLHTKRGRLEAQFTEWPVALPELARRHEASFAIELSTGALEELSERFSERMKKGQTYLEQSLVFLQALRELEDEGMLVTWPKRIRDLPLPSARLTTSALDLLCEDGRSLVLGVFRGGELYTGLVARRRGPGFDRIVGPDELRPQMGLLSGDYRRDYRHLAHAAEGAGGPLSVGVFGELSTFRALAGDPAPGAFAFAVAARDLIVSPVSPALALPIGLDVGRAALAGLRELASRLKSNAALSPFLGRAEAFMAKDLSALLGFNPWALLVKLFERDRDRTEQD